MRFIKCLILLRIIQFVISWWNHSTHLSSWYFGVKTILTFIMKVNRYFLRFLNYRMFIPSLEVVQLCQWLEEICQVQLYMQHWMTYYLLLNGVYRNVNVFFNSGAFPRMKIWFSLLQVRIDKFRNIKIHTWLPGLGK